MPFWLIYGLYFFSLWVFAVRSHFISVRDTLSSSNRKPTQRTLVVPYDWKEVAAYPHPPPYLHFRWENRLKNIGISLVRETGIFPLRLRSKHLLSSLLSPLTARENWRANMLPRGRCTINKATRKVLTEEKKERCRGEIANLKCHVLEPLKWIHLRVFEQSVCSAYQCCLKSTSLCLLWSQDVGGQRTLMLNQNFFSGPLSISSLKPMFFSLHFHFYCPWIYFL